MIFGLALSVGAITLVSSPPTDVSSVIGDLAIFGFSFLILILIWLRYTNIMSALPLDTREVINLNIILLFLVSAEPFLFNLVRRPPAGVTDPGLYGNVTSGLYAADLGMMFVILGFFSLALADEGRHLIPKDLIAQYKRMGNTYFGTAAIFLVSLVPFFYTFEVFGQPLRYDLWAIPLVFVWLRRRYHNVKDRVSRSQADPSTSSGIPAA